MAEDEPVEIVNFHVTAVGTIPKPKFRDTCRPGSRNRRRRTRRASLISVRANAHQVAGLSPRRACARRA